MKSVIISVAGLYYKIFFEEKEKYLQEHLLSKEEIITTLTGFIFQKPQKKIDGYLEIKVPDRFAIYTTRHNRNYVEICQYKKINYLVSYYHVSLSQLYYVYSFLITPLLTLNKGFYLHASACLFRKKAIIFLGKEGTGKSTIVNMLKSKFRILADDKAAIRVINNENLLFQIPYYEKTKGIQKNYNPTRIKNIYFLKQGKTVTARKLTKKVALSKLLKHVLIPELYKKETIANYFEFMKLAPQCYELTFPLDKKEVMNYFENL